jgi:heptosyltransferase-2
VQRYAALAGPLPGPPCRSPAELLDRQQQQAARRALGLPPMPRRSCSAPAPNTVPPSAGRRSISPHWRNSLRRRGIRSWLIGSDKDAAVGDEIVAASGGTALNLCGRSTLEQAIDLIARRAAWSATIPD